MRSPATGAALVALTILEVAVALTPQRGSQDTGAAPPTMTSVQVGEIVGVSYSRGRYLLWATPPGKIGSSLYSDEVIQIARLALEIGDDKGAGFSLDFGRKAMAPFQPADILEPVTFGAMLASKHPVAEMLRGLPAGAELAASLAAQGGKKDLLKRAAELLNRARGLDLLTAAPPHSLSPETLALRASGVTNSDRLSRMILEDVFSPVLQRDIQPTYRIQYKPGEISEKAAELLAGTRSEAILLAADAALKRLSAGNVGGEYSIGPPELVLCGEEARAELLRGRRPGSGEYVNFFSLDLDYDRMAGVTGVWMREPRLIAHADAITGETPACASHYVTNLTARLPSILGEEGEIPRQLRDLRTLLVLQRALVFLSNCASMSPGRLKTLAAGAERFPNNPPAVIRSPLMIAAGRQALQLNVSGGVLFGNKPAPLPLETPDPAPAMNMARGMPGLELTRIQSGNRTLLCIDLSSILAPM